MARAKSAEAKMTLGQHLKELRRRFLISALAIIIGMAAGWFITPYVWDAMREPMLSIASSTGRQAQINYPDIASALNLKLQIAAFIGIVIACPVWLFQIWGFIVPGLTKKEKVTSGAFIFTAIPLFLGGCYMGWLAFPQLVDFMTSFAPAEDSQIVDATIYLKFVLQLMVIAGIGFVTPLALVLLNFLGILSGKSIIKGWRWAIIVIIAFTAIATPTTDVFTMFLLAIPMFVLYILACLISLWRDKYVAKKREEFLAAEEISVG